MFQFYAGKIWTQNSKLLGINDFRFKKKNVKFYDIENIYDWCLIPEYLIKYVTLSSQI